MDELLNRIRTAMDRSQAGNSVAWMNYLTNRIRNETKLCVESSQDPTIITLQREPVMKRTSPVPMRSESGQG